MNIIEVTVEHSGNNLSAYTDKAPIITVGKDIKEIEENFREAIELYLEDNLNPAAVFGGVRKEHRNSHQGFQGLYCSGSGP